jgi:hypothetical protein
VFIFTNTLSPKGGVSGPALWISSSNLNAASGYTAWNNAMTIWDGDIVWQQWLAWGDMWNGALSGGQGSVDYFKPDQVGWNNGGGAFWSDASHSAVKVSPDPVGSFENSDDLWAQEFKKIVPPGLSSPGDNNTTCKLDIAMAQTHDQRKAIIDEVVGLKFFGCQVRVVASSRPLESTKPDIEDATLTRMCGWGIPVKVKPRLHDKMAVFRGRIGTISDRHFVWTGSHNWTYNAENVNDELQLNVYDSSAVHGVYQQHFNNAWLHSSTTRWCN